MNALLRRALAGAPAELRRANVDGATCDLVSDGPFVLGTLARVVGSDRERAGFFQRRMRSGDWFVNQLPAILDELREDRNAAAHGQTMERAQVEAVRARLVGVGCKGTLLELAEVRVL